MYLVLNGFKTLSVSSYGGWVSGSLFQSIGISYYPYLAAPCRSTIFYSVYPLSPTTQFWMVALRRASIHSGAYRNRTYTAFMPDGLATRSATITAMPPYKGRLLDAAGAALLIYCIVFVSPMRNTAYALDHRILCFARLSAWA